jgi:hypothetical protein
MREFMLGLVGVDPMPGHSASRPEMPTAGGDALETLSDSGGDQTVISAASMIRKVDQFTNFVANHGIDDVLRLLARGVAFDSPVTGTIKGRRFIEKLLRDRHAMVARLADRQAGAGSISWSKHVVNGSSVSMTGTLGTGDRISVCWTFDSDGLICRWSWRGPSSALVQYYLRP